MASANRDSLIATGGGGGRQATPLRSMKLLDYNHDIVTWCQALWRGTIFENNSSGLQLMGQ